jgi:hypothetical protein
LPDQAARFVQLGGVFDESESGKLAILIRVRAVNGLQGITRIGYVRCSGQPLRVYRNVPLVADHLFARAVSLVFRVVGVPYALGINDQEAGRGVELIRQASFSCPIVQLHWRDKELF